MKTPKPYMKPGHVYSADNGMLICIHCAGQSALYTGRDISGQRIHKNTAADAAAWQEVIGRPLTCECGKTTFNATPRQIELCLS